MILVFVLDSFQKRKFPHTLKILEIASKCSLLFCEWQYTLLLYNLTWTDLIHPTFIKRSVYILSLLSSSQLEQRVQRKGLTHSCKCEKVWEMLLFCVLHFFQKVFNEMSLSDIFHYFQTKEALETFQYFILQHFPKGSVFF